jgi:acyl-CoA hydrolase
VNAERVLAEFRPGMRVYIQGAGGEPLALGPILASSPQALDGVTLVSCLLPGINSFDYAALHPGARLETFMLSPALRASFAEGRTLVRPLAYSQILQALAAAPPPDLAIFQLTPPDPVGECSFGPCTDFAPLVWARARRRLAFINPSLPRVLSGPEASFRSLEVAIQADGPIVCGEEAPAMDVHLVIAERVARIVPDGAAIQSGLGAAPAAAIAGLTSRRGLVVRSGMVTPGYRRLREAGALDPDNEHITGLAHGPVEFVRWAARAFTFADASVTHGSGSLGRVPRLHAINSALEVDLFGQANIEWRDGKLVSGLGGAPDFARAARRSGGGRAILALPATAAGGKVSRIVARLSAPTVSIPRDDADLVVTEHGVADLRGRTLDERAEALVGVAAPEHREALAEAWARMRASF